MLRFEPENSWMTLANLQQRTFWIQRTIVSQNGEMGLMDICFLCKNQMFLIFANSASGSANSKYWPCLKVTKKRLIQKIVCNSVLRCNSYNLVKLEKHTNTCWWTKHKFHLKSLPKNHGKHSIKVCTCSMMYCTKDLLKIKKISKLVGV